jgi:hypothetical protein
VAFCPAITVWPMGCAVIESAELPDLFPAEVIPTHPALKLTTANNKKIKTKRFMFPPTPSQSVRRRAVRWREQE